MPVAPRPRAAWLALSLSLSLALSALPPRTFGVGLTAAQVPVCAQPTPLLDYALSPGAELGILSHFWATGDVDANDGDGDGGLTE